MGWLSRLFGKEAAEKAKSQSAKPTSATAKRKEVPPERVGLDGQYDRNGLAKRVAKAFDDDPQLDDIDTLWVAQSGSTVVLKGSVPDRAVLERMVKVARRVEGATAVDSSQVSFVHSDSPA